ncbi:hypothetical protein [Leisingera sp. ANG-Vp]|uniref:hypothetical protein n=1 Tax=Leisingera sp. ANG-Vp TaxID=1577896 RepID=UPI00057C3A50|nr:hypothetical protein [Leisingera sp. ANG-Vp]KIC22144.1 hypothetical protein RA20_02040 [Leisingera sp. ANG-Vp]
MNKITLEDPFQGPPAPAAAPVSAAAAPAARKPAAAQPADQAAADPAPVQPPRLSAAVLAQIAAALRKGDTPLAAQEDLVALHKRIVDLFATLNEGLGARHSRKAAEDRAALTARIDELEAAVNRMEGALRIEFEPVLKAAVAEALAAARPAPPRRRWRRGLALLVLTAAALAAGAYWHAPLQDAAQTAAAALESRTGWQIPVF